MKKCDLCNKPNKTHYRVKSLIHTKSKLIILILSFAVNQKFNKYRVGLFILSRVNTGLLTFHKLVMLM